jgi:hypothetical protein
MKWAGLVARGRERGTRTVFVVNLKERDHFEELGVGGRILLKWILKQYVWRLYPGLIWYL